MYVRAATPLMILVAAFAVSSASDSIAEPAARVQFGFTDAENQPLTRVRPGASPGDATCHDGIWEDGEFCGRDAYLATDPPPGAPPMYEGVAELNHDCYSDAIDFRLFARYVLLNGPNISADLDGSGGVTVADLVVFQTVGPWHRACPGVPSGMQPDQCQGTAALSFTDDPGNMIRTKSVAPGLIDSLFVILDGYENASCVEIGVVTSDNLEILDHHVYPLANQGEGWGVFDADAHHSLRFQTTIWESLYPGSPRVFSVVRFRVLDGEPASLRLEPFPVGPGALPVRLRWTNLDADHSIDFATILNAGVNGPPPPGVSTCGYDLGDPCSTLEPFCDAGGTGGIYEATVGEAVMFDGSASSDPDGAVVAYWWDFGDGAIGIGPQVVHTYDFAATYAVTLTVTDNSGAWSACEATAAIGSPPVCDAGGPYAGAVGEPIQLDGSGSHDPGGTIVTYDWEFGDGATGSGATPSHMYAVSGLYLATLTVTDDTALSTSCTTDVDVNAPPVCDANGPYTGVVGDPVAFDGTGSHDPDGVIVGYAWEFGDGATGGGATATHVYGAPALYVVTLTVTDDGGLSSSCGTSASIGSPPVCDAGGPYAGTAGEPMTLDGSASHDPDGVVVGYAWEFGDGATGAGAITAHVYTAGGLFTVTLTVTDNSGLWSACGTTANVNLAPLCDAGGAYAAMLDAGPPFLATAKEDEDSVAVIVGRGDGTFEPPTFHPTGRRPAAIALGDLNMDLIEDIAVPDVDDNTVTVLLADAPGVYGLPHTVPTVDGKPYDVAIARIDDDPFPDLVAAIRDDDLVAIHLGDGNGVFSPPFTSPVIGDRPIAVATADLQDDGFTDVVVALEGDHAVAVLLGLGGGMFVLHGVYPTDGMRPTDVAIARLDGDPLPDVVVTNQDSDEVSVLLGTGDGFLAPAVTYGTGGDRPGAVSIGDLDHDMDADLVISNRNTNTLAVLLGHGDGTFDPAITFPSGGTEPRGVALCDVDSDQVLDIATPHRGDGQVAIHRGHGDGSFDPPVLHGIGLRPTSIAAGRLPDLAVVAFDGSGSSDPDGTIVEYAWQFGDGAFGSGVAPTHAYLAAGVYTVTLCVTDDLGATVCCESTVEITEPTAVNEPPVVQSPVTELRLHEVRPNPFNPSTTIHYELPVASRATLRIFDVGGHVVRRLVDRECEAGAHAVEWDGRDDEGRQLGSGVYIYRLEVSGRSLSRKMVMMK